MTGDFARRQTVMEQVHSRPGRLLGEDHLDGRRARPKTVTTRNSPGEDHSVRRLDLDVRSPHGNLVHVDSEGPPGNWLTSAQSPSHWTSSSDSVNRPGVSGGSSGLTGAIQLVRLKEKYQGAGPDSSA